MFIGEYLLGQLDIAFCALRADVIGQNRLAVAWGFGQPDVPRDHGSEDFAFEEVSQVLRDLAGQGCTVIKHSQQDTFDFEFVMERIADAVDRVEKL